MIILRNKIYGDFFGFFRIFFIWCWHTWVFLWAVPYFDFPQRLAKFKQKVKILGNTTHQWTVYKVIYDPIAFFFRQDFLLVSHKTGKAKWIEKRSVRSRPVQQVFLHSKLSTVHTWYIHIFALFELYLVQLDYKIKLSCCTPHRCSTTISLETKPIYSYVVNYNACRWCEAKSNQNILNRLRLE